MKNLSYKTFFKYFEEIIASLLSCVTLGLVVLNVITRYVLRDGIPWSEEFAAGCFVWTAFIGAAACYKRRQHMGVDVIVKRLPQKVQNKDYTLDELQTFDAGYVKNGAFGFQPIPSFEEFCQWLSQTDCIANIELKTSVIYYPHIEEKVVEAIRRYKLENKVLISSFNHMSLIKVKELAPELPLGALVELEGLMYAGFFAKQFGIDYYHPDYCLLSDEAVKE